MDSPVQAEDQAKGVGTTIENLSKGIALCIAVLYVCGFLITSLHDFKYGFAEMNPLRPRILTAGAWFLLSLALPFALVRELTRHELWNSDIKWWFKLVSLVFAYYLSCNFLFLTAGSVFVFDDVPSAVPDPPRWVIALAIAILLIAVIAATILFKIYGPKIPKSILAVGGAFFFGYIIWQAVNTLFLHERFHFSALILWMLGVGTICLYEMRLRSWEIKLGDWPRSLVTVLVVLLIFATAYYPHIKSSWGGGTPIPITLTLTKDSVALANQQISCLLIEETDSGFYVIGKDDKHATFIPRGSVGLIHFADGTESSLFTTKGK